MECFHSLMWRTSFSEGVLVSGSPFMMLMSVVAGKLNMKIAHATDIKTPPLLPYSPHLFPHVEIHVIYLDLVLLVCDGWSTPDNEGCYLNREKQWVVHIQEMSPPAASSTLLLHKLYIPQPSCSYWEDTGRRIKNNLSTACHIPLLPILCHPDHHTCTR